MTHDELVALIQTHGAMGVATMITDGLVVAGLRDGLDLTGWHCRAVPGAILFFPLERRDGRGDYVGAGRMILAIHGSEADRARWERELAEQMAEEPITLLMVER